MSNIKVKKDELNPESPEVLAASIIKISEGFEKLTRQGITEDGLITLLKGMRGMQLVGRREISLVLQNLKRLKGYYVRKPSK